MDNGTLAIVLALGIPLLAIWTSHKRSVMQMQLRLRDTGAIGLQAEVEALRGEIKSLRDTTMQYDLSFDTALQRLEQRVSGLEEQVSGVAQNVRAGARGA